MCRVCAGPVQGMCEVCAGSGYVQGLCGVCAGSADGLCMVHACTVLYVHGRRQFPRTRVVYSTHSTCASSRAEPHPISPHLTPPHLTPPRASARPSAQCFAARRRASTARGTGASSTAAAGGRPGCWRRRGCTRSPSTASGSSRTTRTPRRCGVVHHILHYTVHYILHYTVHDMLHYHV